MQGNSQGGNSAREKGRNGKIKKRNKKIAAGTRRGDTARNPAWSYPVLLKAKRMGKEPLKGRRGRKKDFLEKEEEKSINTNMINGMSLAQGEQTIKHSAEGGSKES